VLKDEVTVDIRGAKPLVIPVLAEILVPNVNIDLDEVAYGEVIVGKKTFKEFTLVNESQITSVL